MIITRVSIVLGLLGWMFLNASTISIQPTTLTVTPGQSFSLNINASGVANLYGFQFDLGFAPTVLSATSIREAAFLQGGGSTFFIPGMIDNAAGTISFIADTLVGAVSGVNGSGTLATVQFKASTLGTSPLNLSNITLLDSGLASIPTTTANGSITVQQGPDGGAVPEPSSFWMLAGGLAGLITRVRRNRRA